MNQKTFSSKYTAQQPHQNPENTALLSVRIDECAIMYTERVERSLKYEITRSTRNGRKPNEATRPVRLQVLLHAYSPEVQSSGAMQLEEKNNSASTEVRRAKLSSHSEANDTSRDSSCLTSETFAQQVLEEYRTRIGLSGNGYQTRQSVYPMLWQLSKNKVRLSRELSSHVRELPWILKSTLARECLITKSLARAALTPQGGFRALNF